MAALIPFLKHVLAIERPVQKPVAVITESPVREPEEELLTVIYQMEEDSTKVDDIYIEVFRPGEAKLYYLRLPVDIKMTLSTELYTALQTYAPELPQYMKLSRMAESFSKEYALTGCNRMLSELLGVSLEHYVCAGETQIARWMDALSDEDTAARFFERYELWLKESRADLREEERWMYFESYRKIKETETDTAPGTQGADGYNLSQKQTKEKLEEMRSRLLSQE